jgi:hypothetical protein
LNADLVVLNAELFGNEYYMADVPISRQDDRRAKWDFWNLNSGWTDYMFTVSLFRGHHTEDFYWPNAYV